VTRAREWHCTLADPAILSDLAAAARDCQRQVCTHDPGDCDCSANMMTPAEFVDWITAEIATAAREPVRFEKGHRPRRRKDDVVLATISGLR
jgi:hypothetical protein